MAPNIETVVATPTDDSDRAIEALASVIRTFGRRSVELDDPQQEDFPGRCEAWALHLLRNAPAPVGDGLPRSEDRSPPGPIKKAYADLQRFVTARRTLEQTFMLDSLSELRDVLLSLVGRLRGTARSDAQSAGEMTQELDMLSAAAENLSLAELRAQVRRSVDVIGQAIEDQRDRREEQLQALGKQLVSTRDSLHRTREQAKLDPLTGLDNRSVLDEGLERYVTLAEAAGEPLVAVMLDLDNFKAVNDTYGHAGGDAVLKAVGGLLTRAYLRKCDLVCRYGGEEFCVLLPSTSKLDAARLTERLLAQFRKHVVEHDGAKIRFTGSAGIAELMDGETGAAMLKRADHALYAAKADGRDRVFVG